MAYDTDDLLKRGLKEIKKKKLVFHDDVFEVLGIASSTYYTHFPSNSSKYKQLELALNQNRVALRVGLRNKWYNDGGDSGKLYLYKLVGTAVERERLSTNYNKNENSGEVVHTHQLDLSKLSKATLLEMRAAYVTTEPDRD